MTVGHSSTLEPPVNPRASPLDGRVEDQPMGFMTGRRGAGHSRSDHSSGQKLGSSPQSPK